MIHNAPLITTLVGGFVLAFALGAVANWFRMSPIVGYLVAGIVVGPYSPGFVADAALAPQLAEIGVILLMFGVGLHFSLADLMAVRKIAAPGAVIGILAATTLGTLLGLVFGWTLGSSIVFGLCLSVASTVVLLRSLEDHGMLESRRGRIAVGWLIVEDLAMVLTLVLLPAVAGALGGTGGTSLADRLADGDLWLGVALTIGKVGLFVAVMVIVGRRVIPWVLERVAFTGSRELFTLALLATALGVAFAAAELSGASFALGAFFAGMVLSESSLSQDAAEQTLPLRDAFAVLFFVSVGMLLDPAAILSQPLPVLGTVLAILIGKGVFAFAIVRLFGYPLSTAGMVGVSLAQIGEFSFILATLGVNLAVLPAEARDLILAGSIITIILNPLLFQLFTRFEARLEDGGGTEMVEEDVWATPVAFDLTDHVILVGYGRVGSRAAKRLVEAGVPIVVVERLPDRIEPLRKEGFRVLLGNADRPEVLSAAGVKRARAVLVAIPNGFEAGNVVALAREMNPDVEVIARAHFDAEVEHLKEQGAQIVLMAENELAQRMAELVLDEHIGLPEEIVRTAAAPPAPEASLMDLTDEPGRPESLAGPPLGAARGLPGAATGERTPEPV